MSLALNLSIDIGIGIGTGINYVMDSLCRHYSKLSNQVNPCWSIDVDQERINA